MPEQPSAENQTAKSIDELIGAAIFRVGLASARAAMVAESPWLGLPVISWIFDFFLDRLALTIYRPISNFATFKVIDAQTTAEREAYQKAESALRAAHLSGDPNALRTASDDFDRAAGSLIRFDGAHSPSR